MKCTIYQNLCKYKSTYSINSTEPEKVAEFNIQHGDHMMLRLAGFKSVWL